MRMVRRGMMCVPLFLVLLSLGGGSSGCGAGGSSRDSSGPSVPSAPVWESRDVGLVGSPGATGPSGKGFSVSASGADIWGGADQFRFVYQPLLGDGTISACVHSLTHSDDWAKAGVMIRESLFPDSAFAMAVTTPSNGVDLQYRTSTAGGAGMASAVSGAAPVWVSLARSGSTFTAQMSSDGSTWTPLGSISIPMRANVYIGLAVTAHTNLAQTTAVFDPVSVTGAAALPTTVVFGNLQPVPFSQVVLSDPFWAPRIETNRTASLPMMYQSFISNGNLDNFPKAAGLMSGDHNGFLWADSDVYKTLEGMSRAIALHPDDTLRSELEGVLANIASAQISSGPMAGYIDTYFQLGNAGRGDGGTTVTTQPWQDPRAMHEDYCHGHLIEAVLAHHRATGRTDFLPVARALAGHLESRFGPGKVSLIPGHEEVELALMKLWSLAGTGSSADLDQASFYVDERGRHSGGRTIYGEYCQDLAPIRTFTEPQGHGVRGPYLWAGATDVAAATGDTALVGALQTIWQTVLDRKMYVTGGTGHLLYNEGYAPDFELSNDYSYNETCSACATMFFSQRLGNLLADGKYMDVLERILYNGFASGRSIDGTRLYYNNFMNRYGARGRMGIACCATNIVRTVPAVGGFQYSVRSGDGLWVHLYMAGRAEIPYGGITAAITQNSTYPWDGVIQMTLSLPAPTAFTLHLRIPSWAAGATASVNGTAVDLGAVSSGYLPISRTWQDGDTVALSLPMIIRRVYADPAVAADAGRVAFARGPIVYCLEGDDNPIAVQKIVIPPSASLNASYNAGLLGGVMTLTGTGQNADDSSPVAFTMIPYAVWDNRDHASLMTVFAPESASAVPVPPAPGRTAAATVSYSYKNPTDTETAVNDGIVSANQADQTIPRFTWWGHTGSAEWIAYTFPSPVTVGRSDILWYVDAPSGGGCDYPQTISHEYWDGAAWQPVSLLHDYGDEIDLFGGHFTIVRWSPVTTTKIRLSVQLQPGKSAGILEWRLPP